MSTILLMCQYTPVMSLKYSDIIIMSVSINTMANVANNVNINSNV